MKTSNQLLTECSQVIIVESIPSMAHLSLYSHIASKQLRGTKETRIITIYDVPKDAKDYRKYAKSNKLEWTSCLHDYNSDLDLESILSRRGDLSRLLGLEGSVTVLAPLGVDESTSMIRPAVKKLVDESNKERQKHKFSKVELLCYLEVPEYFTKTRQETLTKLITGRAIESMLVNPDQIKKLKQAEVFSQHCHRLRFSTSFRNTIPEIIVSG